MTAEVGLQVPDSFALGYLHGITGKPFMGDFTCTEEVTARNYEAGRFLGLEARVRNQKTDTTLAWLGRLSPGIQEFAFSIQFHETHGEMTRMLPDYPLAFRERPSVLDRRGFPKPVPTTCEEG
jgi:hypothetical protein